jgi:hypothetical protein
VLSALAAAIGAAILAAGLATMAVAACLAIGGFGRGNPGLRESGGGENGDERKNGKSVFHENLLDVNGTV